MLEVVSGWPSMPSGWDFRDVAGVAVDSGDNVYLAVRTLPAHQVVIFSKEGEFIDSWGRGSFTRIHGISIWNDFVYVTDVGSHGVYKYTLDGRLVLTLNAPPPPPPVMELRMREGVAVHPASVSHAFFDGPTRVAVDSRHDIYVADGYGNSYIHRFRNDGQYMFSWGSAGRNPGQFSVPHSIFAYNDALYVCDRENGRVQVFTGEGKLVAIWPDLPRVADIHIDRFGTAFLALLRSDESAAGHGGQISPIESHVEVRSCDGAVVQDIGGGEALSYGNFVSAHALCVDSEGSLYVGEATATNLTNRGRTESHSPPYVRGMKTIQKFALVDKPQRQ